MPYIDSKVTVKLSEDKKETLKSALGQIITSIPGKSENFLMVGFQDEYTLYLAGEKLEKGAFVEVKIFGSTSEEALEKVTAQICELYQNELGISPKSIYVKYEFVNHWGWNGTNF